MAISSRARPTSDTEGRVDHWQRTGLLAPSDIKPAAATLDTYLVIKKPGHLSDGDRAEAERVQTAAMDTSDATGPAHENH